jgi:hypothetical protein
MSGVAPLSSAFSTSSPRVEVALAEADRTHEEVVALLEELVVNALHRRVELPAIGSMQARSARRTPSLVSYITTLLAVLEGGAGGEDETAP